MNQVNTMIIALVQMNSQQDENANVEKALTFVDEAARQGAEMVALPEYFHFMAEENNKLAHTHLLKKGKLTQLLGKKAAERGVYLLGGTFLETSDEHGMCYNTSTLFGPDGSLLSFYRKIHLFDLDIPGRLRFLESSVTLSGREVVVAKTPLGRWGMSICYDLRFPELYRSLILKGAELIFAPSAFALLTGKDHWEPLLRARAIENQVYMIAPNQMGAHTQSYQSMGNSMIVDPWGTVIARAVEQEGVTLAHVDLERVKKVRTELPCLGHRAPDVYSL